MLAEERQNQILKILKENGAVTTSILMKTFDVSIETIRRDLLEMEQRQIVRRVHGGAILPENDMIPFSNLSQRSHERIDKKIELSRTAAKFVSEGDFIGIDEGSTAIYFAQMLKECFSRLTIVTHALNVFEVLRGYKNFDVILCGGHFMPRENAFYGPLTIDMYEKLHLQKSFIFPSAVSEQFGICDYQKELYLVQKKMMEISDAIYILADSSKFEKKALLKIDDMKSKYTYITDKGLDSAFLMKYQEKGLQVII